MASHYNDYSLSDYSLSEYERDAGMPSVHLKNGSAAKKSWDTVTSKSGRHLHFKSCNSKNYIYKIQGNVHDRYRSLISGRGALLGDKTQSSIPIGLMINA